jgi:hypothetical protein
MFHQFLILRRFPSQRDVLWSYKSVPSLHTWWLTHPYVGVALTLPLFNSSLWACISCMTRKFLFSKAAWIIWSYHSFSEVWPKCLTNNPVRIQNKAKYLLQQQSLLPLAMSQISPSAAGVVLVSEAANWLSTCMAIWKASHDARKNSF